MRIKLTLKRAEGKETNLAVTTDSTATVGDVARALARNDPEQAGRPAPTEVSLRIRGANHRSEEVLDPGAEIHDSGLRSGALVELVPSSSSFVSPTRGTAAAIVHVLAGPDAGKEFRLPQGTSYIGRGPDNDVRLTDPMVSARHARVLVTNAVDLVDLNSANGIVLGGVQVARVALTPTDQVLLGDTVIQVTALGVAPLSAAGPVIEFNRSPRVVARFGEHKIPAPKPPGLPEPEPLPILAMLAPMIMGVLLFVFTRSVLSFVFMALSPLLLIASYADRVISDRRHLKAARKRFVAAANLTEERIRRDHAIERSVREARCPSVAASISAVHRLDGLLWTKRPEHADFLELRLGIGASPSQCKIDLPQENNTDPASWERLEELHAQCAVLEDAPITANLRECGSLGVAGQVAMADAIARGLVWQIAALHSPAEVVLAAIMSRPRRAAWGWLEWLPHTSSPHSPLSGDHLAEGQGPGTSLLARLEDVVETRAASMVSHRVFPAPRGAIEPNTDPADRPPIPSIVVIVSDDAPLDRGRLNRLVERGPDVGVHVIWLAERLEAVPAACRTFILPAASADGAGATAGQVRKGLHSYPVLSETVDETTTMGLARSLAAVLDAGAPVEDASDLPRALSYLALTGQELAQAPQAVIERWTQTFSLNPPDGTWMPARKKATGLRALVGQAGTDAFSLDLRVQGPHALVGGTTGAGKSEFLQTWVVGLASRYSPDRVTFLFVDYKGGAAFADCTSLPHHVGLVTDLSPHMVRRALTSLRAELRYREHLLNKKKAKDLLELERSGDPECPPSLIIIVDEFAALVQEVPEFVDGVIDVAQRGRSLGLHLILATQRPAGVIKDNLRANTNLRIALRMADADDSVDVLGDSMAAFFDPTIPGRAAAKTGPGRITPFQTGYLGGWTAGEAPPSEVDVAELDFGTVAEWEEPDAGQGHIEVADPGPTDIARCVAMARAAAEMAGVVPPRKPWREPLAPSYDLEKLNEYRDDEHFLLGVEDEPEHQRQTVVYYEPDRDGNMAIFGAGGTGKSTALRTIAVSATFSARHGGPVHVYCLDFAGGGLRMLEDLPHVGAVIAGDDEERVTRLLRMLRDVVDDRAVRFAKDNASTLGEYRRLADMPNEPRILLLVDGMSTFREEYEYSRLMQWFTVFSQIAADGRPLGVHMVVTADRASAVSPSIASTIQRRVVMRMASEDDYFIFGVPKDILNASSPPGRAVLDGNELQFAILGQDPNVAVQARRVKGIAATATRRGETKAPGVLKLPESVALEDLPAVDSRGWPVIGIDDETLTPIGVEPRGALALSGPPASGRTTALLTLGAALKRAVAGPKAVLMAPRRTALESQLPWDAVAVGEERVSEMAADLTKALDAEQIPAGQLAVFIDTLTDFTGTSAEDPLDSLIKAMVRAEQFVVGESESSTWPQAWTLAKPMKAGRRALMLIPPDMEGDSLAGVSLPPVRVADYPAGRGFLATGGKARKLQVAQTR